MWHIRSVLLVYVLQPAVLALLRAKVLAPRVGLGTGAAPALLAVRDVSEARVLLAAVVALSRVLAMLGHLAHPISIAEITKVQPDVGGRGGNVATKSK